MTQHKDDVTLRHILDYVRDAIAIAEGKSGRDLSNDRMLRYALLHIVCIVGEASGRLSHDLRSKSPDIPWHAVIAMRNRLIHGYDLVDTDVLWDTVTMDFPSLVNSLERLIKETEET